MNIGLIFKLVSNLGTISQALKDFEADVQALFKGQLTKDEVVQFLNDILSIASSGLISLPAGMTSDTIKSTLTSVEQVADDLIQAVKDLKAKGLSSLTPDLGKAVSDLIAAIQGGIVGLNGQSQDSVLAILKQIQSAL